MALRDIISIDEELCDGCGECVPSCVEGALRIVNGKAKVVSDVLCDGMGACVGECPTGALTVIRREAPEFDEAAVASLAGVRAPVTSTPRHGMWFDAPKPRMIPLQDRTPKAPLSEPGSSPSGSRLRQWPIQLHLVPPTAPFFQGKHVLLAADCVPVAVPDFQAAFLDGRGLAIACPKLDQHLESYIEKLTAMVDHGDIQSLTVAIMEVPCCSGLYRLAEQALAAAKRQIPLNLVRVSIRGEWGQV